MEKRNKLVSHHTVLVVGAGPAGVAAAQRLAENEIDVKVIEKRTIIGNPAQCGECIPKWREMLNTFPRIANDVWLEKYFDFPEYIIAQDLETLRVFTPKMKVYGFKLDCFSSHRIQFDGLLAEMAQNAGAQISMNTALTKILKRKKNSELYVTSNGRFTADYVIDASGSLAHVARLRGGERPKNLVPTLYAQCQGDFSPSFDVYIGNTAPGGYAWVIPKGNIANVGLGVDPRRCKSDLKELLNEFVDKLGLEVLSYGGGWIPMGGAISHTQHIVIY
jgi:flavin-dependent dehydrogenase